MNTNIVLFAFRRLFASAFRCCFSCFGSVHLHTNTCTTPFHRHQFFCCTVWYWVKRRAPTLCNITSLKNRKQCMQHKHNKKKPKERLHFQNISNSKVALLCNVALFETFMNEIWFFIILKSISKKFITWKLSNKNFIYL